MLSPSTICETASPSDGCYLLTLTIRYRYGTLIAFANYLIEMSETQGPEVTFPQWLREHREITKLLERRSLD